MTHPLRDLADRLLQITRDHPAYSQGIEVVSNCADHLRAIAGNHEKNEEIAKVLVQRGDEP